MNPFKTGRVLSQLLSHPVDYIKRRWGLFRGELSSGGALLTNGFEIHSCLENILP